LAHATLYSPNRAPQFCEWGLSLRPDRRAELRGVLGPLLGGSVMLAPLPPPWRVDIPTLSDWLFCFSHHRWLLYRTGTKSALEHLCHHLLDTLPRPQFLEGESPLLPLALRQSLHLLQWARQRMSPETGLLFDSTTGEIERIGESFPHPRSESSSPSSPVLTRCVTPLSGRQRSTVELPSGLESKYAGPIHQSARAVNAASLPVGFSRVVVSGGDVTLCGGVSLIAEEAELASRAEALERFLVCHRPQRAVMERSSFHNMPQDEALDPAALCFVRPAKPVYSPDTPLLWTDAIDPEGRKVWVPAQSVWIDPQSEPAESNFISNTTNGTAVGSSFTEAAWFALLELAERDAFFSHWYLQRGGAAVPESSWGPPLQTLVRRFRFAFPQVTFRLSNIATPLGIPVALATAASQQTRTPAFLCAASAHVDWNRAAASALRDLAGPLTQGIDPTAARQARRLRQRPASVRTPEEHRILFSIPEGLDDAAFLLAEEPLARPSLFADVLTESQLDLFELIQRYAQSAARFGVRIALKELAPASLRELGLHCVRAVATEMLPVWYCENQRRVRITPTLRAMAQRDLEVQDLYAKLHPFS
jgi:thiazole/oxazole-forming peptide maturase SagD family component